MILDIKYKQSKKIIDKLKKNVFFKKLFWNHHLFKKRVTERVKKAGFFSCFLRSMCLLYKNTEVLIELS